MNNINYKLLRIFKGSIFSVLFVYTFFSALTIFYSGGFDNYRMTTDIAHYNLFWHEYTNFNLSDLSNQIHDIYINTNELKEGWIPNPFYSIIALFPITIFGSPALLKIIGFSLGSLYLSSIRELLKKLDFNLGPWELNFLLILICTNRWFIKGSLGLSTMFLCAFFFIIGLNISNTFLKSIFFSFSILVRPNFIIIFIPLFLFTIINDIYKNKSVSKLTLACILPLLIYPIWFFSIDSSRPGSIFSFILYSKGQGFDWTANYLVNLINENTKIIVPESIFGWELSLEKFFSIVTSNIGIVFILIKIYILKLFVCLGMRFEQSVNLPSQGGWYIAEFWSLSYFLIVSLPGFIFSIFLMLFKKLSYLEFSCYCISLIYILGTSLFIGDPRYSLIVMPTFIFSLIKGVRIIKSA